VPFDAKVVRLLIASPGDTVDARRVAKETVEEWNSLHAETSRIMILPVMWERDVVREMGGRAQAVVNRQIVDAADALVGLFWTRLGTPTEDAESGTVEEVERLIAAGKPVLLYFSDEPVVPTSIDTEQYERLTAFRDDVRSRGFVDGYASLDELRWKLMKALTRTVRDLDLVVAEEGEPEAPADTGPRASLVAHIDHQREISGVDNKGRPRYRTRERLVIENRGTGVAEQVRMSAELPAGEEGSLPTVFLPEDPLGRVVPRASMDFPMARAFGTASVWDLVVTWKEGENEYQERQTIA
jgi:nucleoside 2-deoxyribosyltransferase